MVAPRERFGAQQRGERAGAWYRAAQKARVNLCPNDAGAL